jgi:hypothetical protein
MSLLVPPSTCQHVKALTTSSLCIVAGPPRPGMMPAPHMGGPPMMPMMGPPPPGMMPVGPGKSERVTAQCALLGLHAGMSSVESLL